MKKDISLISVVLSIAFSAILLTTLIPPEVKGDITYGEYTIKPCENWTAVCASRCDHHVDPPSTEDAWTGCGIAAYYYNDNSSGRYESATYYFQRGYGNGSEDSYHKWTTDLYMSCHYHVDWTHFASHYDYGEPAWHDEEWPTYNWSAWYHNWNFTWEPLAPYYNGYTVGASVYSSFVDVDDPDNRIYISSAISAYDMYASDPNYKHEEYP